MANDEPKKKAAKRMPELTAAEITRITDRLVVLRAELRSNGTTVLTTPTTEGTAMRKEIAALKKRLNVEN